MAKGKVKTAWVNSPEADAVAAFYVQGHSVRETAEKFGVTKVQVNNLAKTRHLSNGKTFAEGKAEENEKRKQKSEQDLRERLKGLGFEYLGGFINKESKIRIRCVKCGYKFECRADSITDRLHCIACQKRETQQRKKQQAEERKKESEQRAEVRRIEREWHRLMYPPKDGYADMHEAFLNRSGICEICGKPYTVREYVELCGLKKAQDNGVCSDECRRIKYNRSVRESRKRRGVRDNHRHRAKKYGCAYDPTVTLPRLIKRDGLRCAICGEMCDPEDHSWSKYCGPMSPSMDHIIPLAKGGGHVWKNVQVAHIICNSEKGDSCEAS